MKNIFKVFSIIAITALIAFSFTACSEDEDTDLGDDGVDKLFQITEIPITALPTGEGNKNITNKLITIAICNRSFKELYAYGQTRVTSTIITVPLLSEKTGKQYTGTGRVYVVLYFDTNGTNTLDDDIAYVYTGGGTLPIEYAITTGTSSLSFNKFTLSD